MGAKLTKIYETTTKTIKMMQNIFMTKTTNKSFVKKNIVFFTFCIYIFLIFAYSIRLHKRR